MRVPAVAVTVTVRGYFCGCCVLCVLEPQAVSAAMAAGTVYTHPMPPRATSRVSLTALLGTPVTDAQGHLRGRLKDIAVATGPEAGRVAGLVLKTRSGLCIVPSQEVMETPAGTLELRTPSALMPLKEDGNFIYLQQDLVDRQIIDVHGRKVVRVNDV